MAVLQLNNLDLRGIEDLMNRGGEKVAWARPAIVSFVILEGAQRLKDLTGGYCLLHFEHTALEKELTVHENLTAISRLS